MNAQPPEGLRALLKNPRSTFAVMWGMLDRASLHLAARALADKQWSARDVSAALQHHACTPSEADADALAADAVAAAATAAAAAMATEIRIVAIYLSTPPQVDVAFGDKTMRIPLEDAGIRSRMDVACWREFLDVPDLPAQKRYREWFRQSLVAATRIEAPPDASEIEHERYGIAKLLECLTLGAGYRSTEGQHVYVDREAGCAYIHFPAIMAGKIKLSMPTMTTRRASEILRDLGWEPVQHRDGDKVLRLWRGPAAPYLSREADWSLIEELDDMRRKHWSERNAARESTQAALVPTDDDNSGWGAL